MPKNPDPKLRQLQDLLSSILEDSAETGQDESSHWDVPVLPPPDPEGRVSSTDLLSWWFRGPRRGQSGKARSDGWDAYFGKTAQPEPSESGPPLPWAAAQEPAETTASDSWAPMTGLFPEPEEQLAEEHAQGAIDCLYDFLHALGRRDTAAAMEQVADDYHVMEGDREVDKLGFRQGLELYIDSLRDSDLDVSLAEAPEALNHPYGILTSVCIQFDAQSRRDGSKTGRVDHRVVLLRQDDAGAWKIHALSPVNA